MVTSSCLVALLVVHRREARLSPTELSTNCFPIDSPTRPE